MMLTSDITIGEAAVYTLLGYAVVFFGLILLMAVVIALTVVQFRFVEKKVQY